MFTPEKASKKPSLSRTNTENTFGKSMIATPLPLCGILRLSLPVDSTERLQSSKKIGSEHVILWQKKT